MSASESGCWGFCECAKMAHCHFKHVCTGTIPKSSNGFCTSFQCILSILLLLCIALYCVLMSYFMYFMANKYIYLKKSNGNIFRPPVNSPHKRQWRVALMFSLICSWINGRLNNGEAGYLRHHRANCDVTLMLMVHTKGTSTTWRHDSETLYKLLAFLCGTTEVTSRFLSGRAGNAEFLCFMICCPEQLFSKQSKYMQFQTLWSCHVNMMSFSALATPTLKLGHGRLITSV